MAARNDRLDIYLVRHAFAAHADPTRWPDDAEQQTKTRTALEYFSRHVEGPGAA